MPPTAFEWLEVLGEGASGTVYHARDAQGRDLAVKLFRSNVAQSPALFKRFRREAGIAAGLAHENLVATYEGGSTPTGRLFLATELVRAGDVHRLMERAGRLSERAALSIACDVLAGLAYLSESGAVHRDVKPENVLLTPEGSAKLSDFGLAKLLDPEGGPGGGGSKITATGEMIGTPFYIAPEQVLGRRDIDARADLYATGAVLFEMLAGRPPFTGATIVDIAGAHLNQPVPDLGALRPDISLGTAGLVLSLLEKDRDRRPATPAEAAARTRALVPDPSLGRSAVREAIRKAGAIPFGMFRAVAAPGTKAQTLSSRDDAHPGSQTPRARVDLRAARGRLTLFAYSGDRLVLGRDGIDKSENDVCLRVRGPGGDAASRKIGSRHIEIAAGPDGATIKDLDSKHGTRVDGVRLPVGAVVPLRAFATLSIAGALELELRSIVGPRGVEAVVLMRPQNSPDQAYALIRDRLVVAERQGVPILAPSAVLGPAAELAARPEGFALDGVPAGAGDRLQAGELLVEVGPVRPEDMK